MRNIYNQVVYITIVFVLFSCSDYLEVTSKSQVPDETLWTDPVTADLFLNNVYAGLPGPFNTDDPGENWSDNSMNGIAADRYSKSTYAISAYTPSNVQSPWGHYDDIRKANLFIEKVSGADLPEDWKKQRLAEARFLRAYYYMLLWTHHGGVPVITDVLDQDQGDDIFRPRNSAEETGQFIINECEAIANDLPVTAGEPGRVTRGAALTLKGWCELFWASPLHNTDNDKEKWAAAAATNKRVMDMGVYELFPDFNTLFFEENNNNIEVIFDKQYLGGTPLGGSREGMQGTTYVGGAHKSRPGANPTQELVDEYCMANGLPITDPASGYDPQNPYQNREKRFYESIVYDGAEWLEHEIVMKQGVGDGLNATDISDANEATNTGYYFRKGLNPKYTVSHNNRLNSASFVIFRYAEVLLSYAEAQNQAVGPDASVYDAVNQVRARSGLPPLKEGMTQEEMSVAIHRERRVELAFEEKRWYDLIRLKIAEERLNGPLYAMVIERENDAWVYKVAPAAGGSRVFDPEKNYFLPIPQDAIDRNPKLEQNPNY